MLGSIPTVVLIAAVTCTHFGAPPVRGAYIIEDDLSSTMRMSGGRPRCRLKFCTPQFSASGVLSMPPTPPEPPLCTPPPEPLPLVPAELPHSVGPHAPSPKIKQQAQR